MHRFRDILYVGAPGGGVTPAFLQAVGLARADGGRLTIALAVDSAGSVGSGPARAVVWRGLPATDRGVELWRLVRAAESRGVGVRTRLLAGGVSSVVEAVEAAGHDLVVKPVEGGDGVRTRLFAGPDRRLMRECPCPVWLHDPSRAGSMRSVLAAVDVSSAGLPELSAQVVRLASSLAALQGATLHVMHAWWLAGESVLRSRGRGVQPARFRELLLERKRQRADRLRDLLEVEAVAGVEPVWHLVKASPADGIHQVARRVDADVVVLGTLGRSGIQGLVIGNTAEAVLSRVDRSVVVVKPGASEWSGADRAANVA